MIKLRQRQVLALPPFAATVVGIPHATVVTGKYRLRIGRIDPDVVEIAVGALKAADHGKALAGVLTQNERAIGLEKAIRIFRIHNQVREVKRAPHHPIAFIALVPRHSAVVRNEERAVGGFYEGVDALCIGWRDRHRETAIWFLRETLVTLGRDLAPGSSAVRGTE
jgi:hypothetical protein